MSKNVFGLDGLIAWLEKQPSGNSYDYGDGRKCLLAQYFKQNYDERACVSATTLFKGHTGSTGDMPVCKLPDYFDAVARGTPRTFGGALERAKGYQEMAA